MSLEPRSLVSMLPSTVVVCLRHAFGKNAVRLIIRMWRKLLPMQHDLRFGERRNEAPHRCLIASQCRAGSPHHFMNVESVCREERPLQEFSRNFESNKLQISRRSEGRIPQFVNIEGKLSANVTVWTLAIGYLIPELLTKLWKLDRRRGINGLRMAN